MDDATLRRAASKRNAASLHEDSSVCGASIMLGYEGPDSNRTDASVREAPSVLELQAHMSRL